MLYARLVSLKTFLKSAQNQSLSSEICSESSHEIGRSLPIVFQRNRPRKFPRNPREIGRLFREFVAENPAKFDFFSRDLPEALNLIPGNARDFIFIAWAEFFNTHLAAFLG